MRFLQTLYLATSITPLASAFYIPGWSIRSYKDNDPIPLSTNKLTSDTSPVTFAYSELPFVCANKPGGWGESKWGSRAASLNLGELLRGDRISVSDYELAMGKDEECKMLCSIDIDWMDVQWARGLVLSNYVVEWIVDNLPGATAFQIGENKDELYYSPGFKLGYFEKQKLYIHNNIQIVIRWREDHSKPDHKVIVGFEVYPTSVAGPRDKCPKNLDKAKPLELALPKEGETLSIPYSYSVYWRKDESIEWANRWDRYFMNDGNSEKIHWLAIFNCVVVAMLLTGTVGVIMLRTLSRDIQNYNEAMTTLNEEGRRKPKGAGDEADEEDLMEDITGWKLVHGDVFRPPKFGGLFAPMVGSGVQLLITSEALLVLSAIGILNPSYRGGFMSFGLFLFVFSGVFSGYFSTRVYKTFKGESWLKNALLTSFFFPSLLLLLLLSLNTLLWASSSSTALPFTTILALITMWLLISTPLTIIGSFLAARKPPYTFPTRTTLIPRQIPEPQPWYLHNITAPLLAGLVPFGVIFIELMFLFKSIYGTSHSSGSAQYYYLYGFLLLIFFILLLITTLVTIISIYFQLCAENYNWWWRSFFCGAASAVYIFIYSAYYFVRYLSIKGLVGALVYFGYVLMGTAVYAGVMGMVGVVGAWWFVGRIYGAIKAD